MGEVSASALLQHSLSTGFYLRGRLSVIAGDMVGKSVGASVVGNLVNDETNAAGLTLYFTFSESVVLDQLVDIIALSYSYLTTI